MDVESILEGCTVIGIDVFFLGLFYRLYRDKATCLKELKDAQHLELNSELLKKIQNNGEVVPYAVITGKVKALTRPLQSEHFSRLHGVIQERIVNEHKIRWIPSLRIWSSTDNNIKRQVANVPFVLCGKAGLFQRKISVEITDPFSAEELILSEVFNDFKKYDESFGEAIIGLLCREHTVGVREVENMLLEGTPLTAVGKLTIENDSVKLGIPDNGSTYFLTPLSYDALVKKILNMERLYKGLTLIMCGISCLVLTFFLKKGYSEVRRRINYAKDLRKCQEARRLRNTLANSQRTLADDNSPKCVVCLENSVEIIILECGHACLCFNCSEQVQSSCPVCRSVVSRLVPVFMP